MLQVKNKTPDSKYTPVNVIGTLMIPATDIPMTIIPINNGVSTPLTRPIKASSEFFKMIVLIPM